MSGEKRFTRSTAKNQLLDKEVNKDGVDLTNFSPNYNSTDNNSFAPNLSISRSHPSSATPKEETHFYFSFNKNEQSSSKHVFSAYNKKTLLDKTEIIIPEIDIQSTENFQHKDTQTLSIKVSHTPTWTESTNTLYILTQTDRRPN